MLRLGAAGKSLGEIGVEAPSVGDCIRAIHRAPIEVRSEPVGQLLVTQRLDGQEQLLATVGSSIARRSLEDDWVTIRSWRDLLGPVYKDEYPGLAVADYIYGPLADQEVVALNPCEDQWLRHPLSNRDWQQPLFR